jgi:hypothetical protein
MTSENILFVIEEPSSTTVNGIKDNMDQIIEVYSIMIQDFMKHMIESVIINSSINANTIIYTGWKSTTHIFCILYCSTKNLKFTYSKFQRAYLVYLEYIEQTISAGNEAPESVLFLYDKIFSECHTEPSISISQQNFNIKTDLFYQITNITNVIFGWNMKNLSNYDRFEIIKSHLHNHLHLMCNQSTFNLCQIIEHVQNKCRMDYEEYDMFLEEFHRYVKKTNLIKTEADVLSIFLNRILLGEMIDVYNEKSLRQFVKWIFTN